MKKILVLIIKQFKGKGEGRESNVRKSAFEMKAASGRANGMDRLALQLTLGRKAAHTHTDTHTYVCKYKLAV